MPQVLRDLFADTGVGRSAYSIMEQGKIDLILSSRPEDRRTVFEEAAGIGLWSWNVDTDELTPQARRALGNLVRFVLLPGQHHATVGVAPLIQDIEFGALIADKAFDANWIIENLNERGAGIIISQRPHRLKPLVIDAEMYKWRHLVENFFCKLKDFKRIAMRADKTDRSFEAMIYLCSAVINSR